jgi:hypothetical protein
VCATAITAGGAVEVRKLTSEHAPKRPRPAATDSSARSAAAATAPAPVRSTPQSATLGRTTQIQAPIAAPQRERSSHPAARAKKRHATAVAPAASAPVVPRDAPVPVAEEKPHSVSGGTVAPPEEPVAQPGGGGSETVSAPATTPAAPAPSATAPSEDAAAPAPAAPADDPAQPGGTTLPPDEH